MVHADANLPQICIGVSNRNMSRITFVCKEIFFFFSNREKILVIKHCMICVHTSSLLFIDYLENGWFFFLKVASYAKEDWPVNRKLKIFLVFSLLFTIFIVHQIILTYKSCLQKIQQISKKEKRF